MSQLPGRILGSGSGVEEQVIPRSSARRTSIDRWIASLKPMFVVIADRTERLRLGKPRVDVGPALITRDAAHDKDRIRRGAVWFIDGQNTGFHVEFMRTGFHVKAWHGKERKVDLWVTGKATQTSLNKDLSVVLVAAGLTTLAATERIRGSLFDPPRKP
jgi:hypothetical protein